MSLSRLSDSPAPARWIARSGALAAATGAAFLLWVLVLQGLRGDLSWTQAQLSLYLHGPYGLSLRVAYCLLALSMSLQALAVQASLSPGARSGAVLGLFWAAAAGLAAVAIGDSYLPQYAPNLAPAVHLLSAQAAFLCVIAAICLQSWYFGRDPRWRAHARRAGLLGAVAFAVLFAHVVLRWGPRGLGQKSAIVLIVAWLIAVGVQLARGPGAAHAVRTRANAMPSTREES
ncbi:DUF998 domain-containing protein [Stenotrophomonas sp. HITSZ_GD]|uniref:DUF998 domain-containing protein n=1 Tax=Stenotrophomonas sp. HITSZ_GD TaxID=3037248 RepID=UPI00240DFE0B|nr:DUF998 domain-containing protein [Stenotrophomonas sp. HITSZ_GD]MDG2527021.1 DUF998 domain-containing protein [Stenotrophomonas sp. HITSZ_GD]